MGRQCLPPAPVARALRSLLTLCVAAALAGGGALGCSGRRTITLAAVPADAQITVDGQSRGRGPVPVSLDFGGGQTHTVRVSRLGYNDRTVVLDGSEDRDPFVVQLSPRTKRVRFVVSPLPALVKVDGRPVSDGAASQASTELPFSVDAADNWVAHVATAERPGFRRAEVTVRYTDSDSVYVLAMQPERKDVVVTTDPPGAEVFVDNTNYGTSPARVPDLVIPTDPQTNAWVGRRLRAVKAGFAPAERVISWDYGQTEYELKLTPSPGPDATAGSVGPSGASPPAASPPVTSPPPPGPTPAAPATQVASAGPVPRPASADAAIATPTTVPATPPRPAVVQPPSSPPAVVPQPAPSPAAEPYVAVPKAPPALIMLRPRFKWGRGTGWAVVTDRLPVSAPPEAGEPDGRKATLVAGAAEGTTVDGPVTSGDGSAVAWAVLSEADNRLRSQLFVRPTAGTGAGVALTDGAALDLMPAFAPGGRRLLFASDRAGPNRMAVYDATINPPGEPTPAVAGEPAGTDLWPTLDPSPNPRLYVEARPADGGAPRLVAVQPTTGKRADLGQPGAQPRVSPRADAVVFVRADPSNGKRDLFLLRVDEPGAEPTNLTNTPEVDEFDPAWSKTGSRIAFASDRPASGSAGGAASAFGRPRDANVWVLRVASPADVVQATANAAWDDSPSWSGDGRSIYFRSARGGEWGVWNVELPTPATGR